MRLIKHRNKFIQLQTIDELVFKPTKEFIRGPVLCNFFLYKV